MPIFGKFPTLVAAYICQIRFLYFALLARRKKMFWTVSSHFDYFRQLNRKCDLNLKFTPCLFFWRLTHSALYTFVRTLVWTGTLGRCLQGLSGISRLQELTWAGTSSGRRAGRSRDILPCIHADNPDPSLRQCSCLPVHQNWWIPRNQEYAGSRKYLLALPGLAWTGLGSTRFDEENTDHLEPFWTMLEHLQPIPTFQTIFKYNTTFGTIRKICFYFLSPYTLFIIH